jgi:hypothetical protein
MAASFKWENFQFFQKRERISPHVFAYSEEGSKKSIAHVRTSLEKLTYLRDGHM